MSMLPLGLTLLLAGLPQGPPPLAVGRPAPGLGVDDWQGLAQGAAAPALGDLVGSVVLVHVVDWDDARSVDVTGALVHELVTANADRGLCALVLVTARDGAEHAARLERLGWERPFAVLEPGATPYFDPATHGPAPVSVIGRSGELAWRGDPAADEEGFLAGVEAALRAHGADPLEGTFGPELDAALAAYWSGDWADARKDALKLAKRHERRDPGVHAQALALAQAVDAFEHACARRLGGELSATYDAIEFWRLLAAVRSGFPRSDALAAGEAVVAERRKALGASSFFEAETFVELEQVRPLWFPVRASAAGKRHAKELERLLVASSNQTEVQRRARALLDAYAHAR